MENTFANNDTISALEAQKNAQKIAFAPVVFQVARCMREFGILKAIYDSENGLSINELNQTLNISTYALKILLETSLSIDIVKLKDEKYLITRTGYFLLKDNMCIANMDYNHHVNYKGLFHLDEALKSEKPVGLKEFGEWESIYPALSSLPPKVSKSWFAFDHLYSDSAYPQAIQIILSQKPSKVLDIGGNTGKFSSLLVQKTKDVHVAILDLPQQLDLAKQRFESLDLERQIELISGNVLSENFSFPKGFDVLWMSQFLDCFNENQTVTILKKAKEVMSEGATLFVMEPFWDRQRFETSAFCIINTSPYFTTMANGNSKMYSYEDFYKLVEKAGLKMVNLYDNLGLCQSILALKAD